MDSEQLKKVATFYIEYLKEIEASAVRFELDQKPKYYEAANHSAWMLQEILDGKVEGEKAHRWLGFVQGSFWILGDFTIPEMKEHNR